MYQYCCRMDQGILDKAWVLVMCRREYTAPFHDQLNARSP